MKKFIYIFFFSGLFAVPELFLRSWGISVPFCAFFIFYATTAFGTNPALFGAFICSAALDFSSGAEHPWSIITLAGVIYLASLWLNKVESDSVMLNFLPGMAIPFITFLGNVIFFSDRFFTTLIGLFPSVLPGVALGAILLPLMILILDTLNHKLGLELYTDARVRRKFV